MSEQSTGEPTSSEGSDAGALLDRIAGSLDAARSDLVALSRLLRPHPSDPTGDRPREAAGGLAAPEATAAGRGQPAMPPEGIDSTDTAVNPDPRESRQARPDQP